MQKSGDMWWRYPLTLLERLEALRPFTEREAWGLFRIAALSEAVGWTILIGGILIRNYNLPGSTIAVPIAGRIHGTIFILYFAVLLAVYSSLRWPRRRFLIAVAAGVPPYGTLIFEQWAAYTRRNHHSRRHFYTITLAVLNAKQ